MMMKMMVMLLVMVTTGIGVVGCQVSELPRMLLRNKYMVGLRIKNSVVGTLRQGLLHNIHQASRLQ